MLWQEKLSSLSSTQAGRREAQEPVTTEIFLEFMSQEVYPRLNAAQASFVETGLESTISPELAEEISSDAISVCLSIKKRIMGMKLNALFYFKGRQDLILT